MIAGPAPAEPFTCHHKSAVTFGTRIPQKNDSIIELPNPAGKGGSCFQKAKRLPYDVHSSSNTCKSGLLSLLGSITASFDWSVSSGPTAVSIAFSSVGWISFWFFAVNFLRQFLHSLILRWPIVLVFLKPLLMEPPPQYGHFAGLPLGILITSRGM